MNFDAALIDRLGGMVERLAAKYTTDPLLQQDLVQEGWLGVRVACQQYDKDKGASLKTYAYWRARATMQHYMRTKAYLVKLPRDLIKDNRVELLCMEGHDADNRMDDMSVDHYRQQRRTDEMLTPPPEYVALNDALERLSDKHRQTLEDRYYENMSVAMMAVKYGMSEWGVYKRLKAATAALKAYL